MSKVRFHDGRPTRILLDSPEDDMQALAPAGTDPYAHARLDNEDENTIFGELIKSNIELNTKLNKIKGLCAKWGAGDDMRETIEEITRIVFE